MRLFLLSVFLLPILTSCATSKYLSSEKYIPLYENHVEEGYKLIKTWRDYSVEERNDTLIYKHYEVETRQLFHRVFLKKNNLEKSGEEMEWFSNGNLRFKGWNRDDKKSGRWEYYSYETGLLEEYGTYYGGHRTGSWNHLDSLGNKTAVFEYIADNRHGPFTLFGSNGEVYKEGVYDEGRLVSLQKHFEFENHPQEILESDLKLISCDNAQHRSTRKACRRDDFNSAARLIAQYPDFEENRDVTGTALVEVEIDEHGQISDIKILRSLSEHFTEEILKLEEIDFIFEPAIVAGEPYKTSYLLTLAYFPPEGTYYHDPFFFNQFMMPPAPTFTPPSF